MSRSYRVFVGAPSIMELTYDHHLYHWQTVSSYRSPYVTFPTATLEAASRRISLLYENIIFRDVEDEDTSANDELSSSREGDVLQDPTTILTWPPTAAEDSRNKDTHTTSISFLRPTTSASRVRSQIDSQGTQETNSYNYSDASSIARFPAFHFNLHGITSLSALISQMKVQSSASKAPNPRISRKVTILAAVLEVEGPDTIRIKKGIDAGKEVTLLKLILGDEDGTICKLAAWRDVAEDWGGADPQSRTPGIKRGDIALFQNILASPVYSEENDGDNAAAISLTASNNYKSTLEICYRTMPRSPEDQRLRPDLRLGYSDAAVRKVAAVVRWFEDMAGLSAT